MAISTNDTGGALGDGLWWLAILITGGLAFSYVLARRWVASALRRLKEEYTGKFAVLQQKEQEHRKRLEDTESTLKSTQGNIEHLRRAHPAFKKMIYHVGVIGIWGSGKTAITLKLTDPFFCDIKNLRTTRRDVKFDRTVVVSTNPKTFTRIEHVFQFHEWGGDLLVAAQNDMISMCNPLAEVEGVVSVPGLQALIFVVDLAFFLSKEVELKDPPHVFDPGRIRKQIEHYFNVTAIGFLLNDRVLPYLQTVILFINKSDTLEGSPGKVRQMAEEYYHELLMGLRSRRPDTQVIVGSAESEVGLQLLYSNLVSRILPEDAWDKQLRPSARPDVRRDRPSSSEYKDEGGSTIRGTQNQASVPGSP